MEGNRSAPDSSLQAFAASTLTNSETGSDIDPARPDLIPNLFIASFQLLFWLFLRPSRWQGYIEQIDPALAPDFNLARLTRHHWQHSSIQRLLLIAYVIWPLQVALATLFVRWLLLDQSPDTITRSILLAVGYSILGGSSLGLTVSFAGSVGYATALGLFFGLMSGAPGHPINVLGYGISSGITGGLLLSVCRHRDTHHPFSRKIGGFTVGILVSAVLLAIAFAIASGTAMGISDAPRVSGRVGLMKSLPFALGGGLLFAVTYATLVGFQIRRWYQSLMIGLVIGIVGGGSYGLVVGTQSELVRVSVSGIGGGLLFAGIFAIPYGLARYVGGRGSGAVAGALVSGLGWAPLSGYLFRFSSPVEHELAWSLFLIVIGLTYTWWLPRLLYPFEQAWNTLIYQIDQRRPALGRTLLGWHSALWDEHQPFHLYGLESHLAFALQRDREAGEAVIRQLQSGAQRWAIQAAQIEVILRELAQHTSLEALAQAHHSIVGYESATSVGMILEYLSKASQKIENALNQTTSFRRRFLLRSVENDLAKLERDLLLKNGPEVTRFYAIVDQWRRIVNASLHELERDIELNQEIDNPYIFGIPLTDEQEIFVGRLDVSARIEQLLSDYRRPPLLLYGQRRMGKTSLLYNLGRLLPNDLLPLFVDGQRISGARDYPDFLYNIAREMIESAAEQRGINLPPLSRTALEQNPFSCFNEWLDQIETLLAAEESTALLALDEFEALEEILARGRFNTVDVMNLLRHLIQHRSRFKVLLASSHPLERFQRWSGYLINVQVVKIDYLEESEARQLIEQPVSGFTLRYQSEAVDRILELTRRHPALIQLLCYEVVELKNQQDVPLRSLATVADVEDAVPQALKNGSFFFGNIENNQLAPAESKLVRFLANHTETTPVRYELLHQHFPDDLDAILQKLLQYELIEEVEDGYRLQIELIRRWFAWYKAVKTGQ
jgi:hypothetical protein